MFERACKSCSMSGRAAGLVLLGTAENWWMANSLRVKECAVVSCLLVRVLVARKKPLEDRS